MRNPEKEQFYLDLVEQVIAQGPYKPDWGSLAEAPVPKWFRDRRLGIFIHWGVYAVKGVSESWSFYNKYLPHDEYMKQCEGFTASKYDPKAWVQHRELHRNRKHHF